MSTESKWRYATPLIVREPQVIADVGSQLVKLYSDVKKAAPNAQIVVMGYPRVVTPGTTDPSPVCRAFGASTRQWMASTNDAFNAKIKNAAVSAGVTFVATDAKFAGHEACVPSPAGTNQEWINGIIVSSSSGSGSKIQGSGSFHPKAIGHAQGYRAAVLPVLR